MQEIAPPKVRERLSTNIYRSSISDLNVPEWVDMTPGAVGTGNARQTEGGGGY
jgi:C4-type Zn-finger protein